MVLYNNIMHKWAIVIAYRATNFMQKHVRFPKNIK